MDTDRSAPELSRQYVKLCERADFEERDVREMVRSIVPGLRPEEELHRKYWEYAMLGLFMRDVGALDERTEVLAVAAGHEAPLYWLTDRVKRVVATDIYGHGSFSSREADGSMLSDPSAFAPYPYREDRLEVQDMNALELRFPDSSFDVIYSLSSIEHFGGPVAASRAAAEMARVLRPGGYLLIATECFVGRNVLDWPPLQTAIRATTLGRRCSQATLRNRVIDVFTPREIERYIVRGSGLELMQPLDLTISEESFENVTRWNGSGELQPATGSFSPHIVLQAAGAPWTSAFLALSSPARS